jgi:6-phosphofructokinase
VTCGGLCPGLNDVVQGLVNKLVDYGVPDSNILGIRYGFKGFYEKEFRPIPLSKAYVDGIHLQGGTILGTSRGGADIRWAAPSGGLGGLLGWVGGCSGGWDWAGCCRTRAHPAPWRMRHRPPPPPRITWPARTARARAHAACRREIVKRIDMWGVDMLFVVGGNGGNAGANAINHECRIHGVSCAVVGRARLPLPCP